MRDRNKLLLLLGLVVVLVAINLARRSSPVASAPPGHQPTASRASRATPEIPDATLDVARLQFIPRGRAGEVRRNIFEYGSRPSPAAEPLPTAAAPPPPPPAPAPVRFFGFAENPRGGKRQVFLTNGEEIFVAAEGDIIARRYRVLRVTSQSVEVEELSGSRRWTVPLEQP